MSNYLNTNYFLPTDTAQRLYHEVAADQPIIDFHTHLSVQDLLTNRGYENITQMWLAHDHYKWRAMRAAGLTEDYVTGDRSDYEKFEAFCSVLPDLVNGPVHQWAHIELRRIFGINEILSADTAKQVWDETCKQFAERKDLGVLDILKSFRYEVVCTTDDPADPLTVHNEFAALNSGLAVYPTFRPDWVLAVDQPELFFDWCAKLAKEVGFEIDSLDSLLRAMSQRHDDFHAVGCRLSDHGMTKCSETFATDEEALVIYNKVKANEAVSRAEHDAWIGWWLVKIAGWNTEKSWTMQLHLGPLRNNSDEMFEVAGRDAGFDIMDDAAQTLPAVTFFNYLESLKILPNVIGYNLNPKESVGLCNALQSFNKGPVRGKMQYGPAWWHVDHKSGILEQLLILVNHSALGCSVGMLTDSRSFTSAVRHEYYRRLLCQFVGEAMESGEMPDDMESAKALIKRICYGNAREYFAFPCYKK